MATQKNAEPVFVRGISSLVKDGAVIQGGSFRLDKGPTATEKRAFEFSVFPNGEIRAMCNLEPETLTSRTGGTSAPD